MNPYVTKCVAAEYERDRHAAAARERRADTARDTRREDRHRGSLALRITRLIRGSA
jgi:hypothetical protein